MNKPFLRWNSTWKFDPPLSTVWGLLSKKQKIHSPVQRVSQL